jgi:hypothetical protein
MSPSSPYLERSRKWFGLPPAPLKRTPRSGLVALGQMITQVVEINTAKDHRPARGQALECRSFPSPFELDEDLAKA